MSLLASLVFALAAFAVVVAIRATVLQYGNAAQANIAALRDCSASREFRVQAVTVLARQTVGSEVRVGDVRRIAARNPAPRRINQSAPLRAAA